VDHRQGEHFDKFFAAVRLMGYRDVILKHVSFGTVLGDDGKPFKTRAGDTVGLEGLLDEAERKAGEVLRQLANEREAEMSAEQQNQIARRVGLGALKFADLSQHRASDYKFSYDKMLELKGFTATYLQYLYARVQGIYRKESLDPNRWRQQPQPLLLESALERELALQLLRFSECLSDVLLDYRPNLLAQYLFDLTQIFFRFYSQCSVLNAETAQLKSSRLQFCDLTARTVQLGLQLMGIEVVDEM
jgi:arginyl-tRNA synthetase